MDDLIVLQSPRPARSDAVRNRELLLQTASRMIDERGVEAVTMSAVAEAAGVGKGTLYRHFPSKTQLIEELLDNDQRDLQERTFAYLRLHAGHPAQCLHWFLTEALLFVERNRIMLSSMGIFNAGTAMNHPAHLWWRLTIRGLLQQIKPAAGTDYLADVLYTLLDAGVVHFMRTSGGYTFDQVRDGLLDTADRLIR